MSTSGSKEGHAGDPGSGTTTSQAAPYEQTRSSDVEEKLTFSVLIKNIN